MQNQLDDDRIEKLASTAQRLRAVKRAQRHFLALWAIESLAGPENQTADRPGARHHSRLNPRLPKTD